LQMRGAGAVGAQISPADLVESGATLQQVRLIVSSLTVIIRPSPRLFL